MGQEMKGQHIAWGVAFVLKHFQDSSHAFIFVNFFLPFRRRRSSFPYIFAFGHDSVDSITEEQRMSTKSKCCQVCLLFFIVSLLVPSNGHSVWRKPGCHKVGHTRKVSIPDCVEFHITTNACRGFCESWSIPSGTETLRVNPFQLITSVGECCNIMETEDVEVKVMCLDGTRELTFKSAKSCSCYHCKKD